jgi:hypothetical protein
MLKKTLIAVSLGLLALGMGRPAAAQATFLSEYGLLEGARPAQAIADNNQPKNALQAQNLGDAKTAWILGGFFSRQDFTGGDAMQWGGGIGLVGMQNPKHPWQLTASAYNVNLDAGPVDEDFFGWSVSGKYVLSLPSNGKEPVFSVYGRYADVNDFGETINFGLAVDQKVTPSLYLTGNVGWLHQENGGDENDLFGGFGATLTSGRMRKLSLSADYTFENDLMGDDAWTVSAIYAVNNNLAFRVGGGEDSLVFANIYYKRGGK